VRENIQCFAYTFCCLLIAVLIGCSQASSFNRDISGWDTSSVTDFSTSFQSALAFSGELPWNTANIIDMSSMFDLCVAFDGDLSSWDVKNVRTTSFMVCSDSSCHCQLPVATY